LMFDIFVEMSRFVKALDGGRRSSYHGPESG
jgi:hypothetical protein